MTNEREKVRKDEEACIQIEEDGVLFVKGPNGKEIQIIGIEEGLAIYP